MAMEPKQPANENADPFQRADTGLAELYRLRRELLAADTSHRPLSWWRDRRKFLTEFEEIERLYSAIPEPRGGPHRPRPLSRSGAGCGGR